MKTMIKLYFGFVRGLLSVTHFKRRQFLNTKVQAL